MELELWNFWYHKARAFYQENGHLRPSRNGDDVDLAWWIDGLRKEYAKRKKDRKLTEEEILALENIGMVWDPRSEDWKMKLDALREYVKKNGKTNPRRGEVYNGVDLGNFLHSLKNQYREGKLDKDKQAVIESLGIIFGEPKPISKKPSERELKNWQCKYAIAEKFQKEFGHLYIPAGYVYCNEKMGDWINTQRRNYKNGTLSDEAIKKLETLGIDWKPGQKAKPKVYEK